jgi:hypothetical protein
LNVSVNKRDLDEKCKIATNESLDFLVNQVVFQNHKFVKTWIKNIVLHLLKKFDGG